MEKSKRVSDSLPVISARSKARFRCSCRWCCFSRCLVEAQRRNRYSNWYNAKLMHTQTGETATCVLKLSAWSYGATREIKTIDARSTTFIILPWKETARWKGTLKICINTARDRKLFQCVPLLQPLLHSRLLLSETQPVSAKITALPGFSACMPGTLERMLLS